jgi:hypothetical protein
MRDLSEARVNVLELNLDLDATYPQQKRASKQSVFLVSEWPRVSVVKRLRAITMNS